MGVRPGRPANRAEARRDSRSRRRGVASPEGPTWRPARLVLTVLAAVGWVAVVAACGFTTGSGRPGSDAVTITTPAAAGTIAGTAAVTDGTPPSPSPPADTPARTSTPTGGATSPS